MCQGWRILKFRVIYIMLSNLKTGVGWGLRLGKCMTGSGKACRLTYPKTRNNAQGTCRPKNRRRKTGRT